MTRAGYKITEIGEIPEDWEIKKIKDVCSIIRGNEPGSKSYNNSGKGYKFIRVSDVSKKVLKSVFVDSNPNKLIFCNKNDVLLVLDGVPGVVAKDFEGAISSGIRIIKPKTNKICNNFLFYILQHRDVQIIIENYTKGTTIKHANNAVDYINIPLPSLPEQQKIAAILSTADDEIQKVDEQVAMTEQIKKGLMQKLLTRGIGHTKFKMTKIGEIPEEWDTFGLGEIFKTITGTTPSTKVKDYWHGGTIEWLTPKDLNKLNNTITLPPSERKVTEKALKENNLNILPENSILISTRAPVGYVGINNTKITFNQGCKGLVPLNRDVSFPFFYAYYLKSKTTFLNSLSTGSTFKELSKEGLDDVVVPLPPLPEQQKIGEILSTVDNKLELLGNKREKLNVLKKGLMNDLFTGKVRVKV